LGLDDVEAEFLQSKIQNRTMKHEAEIDGQPISLELDEKDGRVLARVGERHYDLEVQRPEDGVYLFFAGDKVYEIHVSVSEKNSMQVAARNKSFTIRLIDRKHLRIGAEHTEAGRKQLLAPMPGKVVRILLNEGDEVEAGQGIVIVEAMKMQNEIKSPKSGRVVAMRVSEGDTVTANQVLAVVE
jgi:biotin carboxyl carrier protein